MRSERGGRSPARKLSDPEPVVRVGQDVHVTSVLRELDAPFEHCRGSRRVEEGARVGEGVQGSAFDPLVPELARDREGRLREPCGRGQIAVVSLERRGAEEHVRAQPRIGALDV